MISTDRFRTAAGALAGMLALAAALGFSSSAVAEPAPEPPVDPAAPVEPPPLAPSGLQAVTGALAQNGTPSDGPLGLPDLSAYQNQLFLGQSAVPAPPGTDEGAVPRPNPLNNAYLLPQNVEPAPPGQGQIVGVAPGEENADVSKLDYLHRLWAMYQRGGLQGGLLGQESKAAPAG